MSVIAGASYPGDIVQTEALEVLCVRAVDREGRVTLVRASPPHGCSDGGCMEDVRKAIRHPAH